MPKKYIHDGIGLVQAIDVVIEQLVDVKCLSCGNTFQVAKEERNDPEGYRLSRCPTCGGTWAEKETGFCDWNCGREDRLTEICLDGRIYQVCSSCLIDLQERFGEELILAS